MVKFSIQSINEYVLDIISETIIAIMSLVPTVLGWMAGEILVGFVWINVTILWGLLAIRTYSNMKKELKRIENLINN